jgi:hypothetical protein
VTVGHHLDIQPSIAQPFVIGGVEPHPDRRGLVRDDLGGGLRAGEQGIMVELDLADDLVDEALHGLRKQHPSSREGSGFNVSSASASWAIAWRSAATSASTVLLPSAKPAA